MPNDKNNNFNEFMDFLSENMRNSRFERQTRKEIDELEVFQKLQETINKQNEQHLKNLQKQEEVQKRIDKLIKSGVSEEDAKLQVEQRIQELQDKYVRKNNEKMQKLKDEYSLQMKIQNLREAGLDYIIKENNKKKEELDRELQILQAIDTQNLSKQDRLDIENKQKQLLEEKEQAEEKLTELMKVQGKESKQVFGLKKQILNVEEKIKQKDKEIAELEDKYGQQVEMGDKEGAKQTLNDIEAKRAERQQLTMQKSLISTIEKVGQMIHQKLTQSVDKAISVYSEYMGKVEARLQDGSVFDNNKFDSIVDTIMTNASITPYYSSAKIVENVEKLTSEGISFKIAERSFIASVADKIVAAFEVNDATLTRLIRLYRQDITRAMLGNEARLTKMFNQFFEDTKYLTSGLYDQVSAAIYDAQSMLNYDQATEFNYMVQKWLGALYEAGVADSTVSNIASGINYLATGDVTALNSNQQLSTLLNMAAARGGLSYAEMLTSGLNVDNVNILLSSIIDVLRDIADNTGDNVVKSAYRDILGINVSDLQAVSKMSIDTLNTIKSTTLSYQYAQEETYSQLLQLSERTTMAENIDNALNNLMFSVATEVADDAATYLIWKIGGIVSDLGESLGMKVVSLAGLGMQAGSAMAGMIERLVKNFKVSKLKNMSEDDAYEWAANAGLSTGEMIKAGLSGVGNWDVVYTTRGKDRQTRLGEAGEEYIKRVEQLGVDEEDISESADVSMETVGDTQTFADRLKNYYTLEDREKMRKDRSAYTHGSDPFVSFTTLASDVEKTAQSIVSVQESSTKSVENVYEKLFETQDTPIKVCLSAIDDVVIALLVEALKVKDTQEIIDILQNKISVDIVDQDINSIIDTLRAVRSL